MVELLIVVAVIAVLVTIAYPSYQEFLRKARREDAISSLRELHSLMERFYTENGTYATATIAFSTTTDVLASATTADGHYTLSIPAADAATFTIRATRRAGDPQADDTRCGDYTLTDANVRAVTGTADVDYCW